jgi:nitrogen fixation/metabolism regulation signal transduction histidine kinase
VTLRTRLLLALLSLALLPTLVFTIFTLDELGRATDRWYLPAVDRALESGLEVSRTALTRVEATLLDRADAWAAGAGSVTLDAAGRARLRSGLRESGIDFAQVYRRDESGQAWRLADQVVPAGVLAADSLDFAGELDAALAADRLLRTRQGVLGAVARGPREAALVTGIRLTPDFFLRVAQIGQARELYGRLGVLVDVQRRYLWLLVVTLFAGIAGGAYLLARALAGSMTRPLTSLAAAIERVAGGELEVRVPERGAVEMRTLAAKFNTMAARLADAREAVAKAEREAVWRDVARRLAHEIKNPLTPMRLSLHRLQRRIDTVPEADRAAVRDSVAALLQEVEHLTGLAERFAQYARLPEPRFDPLELGETARAALALHEPEHVRLRFTPGGPVRVRGDRLLLSRALHNLLLNACEAGPPGSEIEVRTGHDEREGWVEVLDRGPGLAPEVAARAFEPYVSTKNRGSGLGLSFVRDIAAQHGGRASIVNREGGGACARLVLPLAE